MAVSTPQQGDSPVLTGGQALLCALGGSRVPTAGGWGGGGVHAIGSHKPTAGDATADGACPFVDRPQPSLSAAARRLWQGLAMPEDCAGSIRNTTPPGGASTTSL